MRLKINKLFILFLLLVVEISSKKRYTNSLEDKCVSGDEK
jgi:hypothetical protein